MRKLYNLATTFLEGNLIIRLKKWFSFDLKNLSSRHCSKEINKLLKDIFKDILKNLQNNNKITAHCHLDDENQNYPTENWYTKFYAREFYVAHKIDIAKEYLITLCIFDIYNYKRAICKLTKQQSDPLNDLPVDHAMTSTGAMPAKVGAWWLVGGLAIAP